MATKRKVIIDNTHPSLQYSDAWQAIDATDYDQAGATGPTFNSTLHAINTNGSFRFPFDGASGEIKGTLNYPFASTASPTITCTLDGFDVVSVQPSAGGFPGNNFVFCQWSALSGPHTATVTVSFAEGQDPNTSNQFLFDYLQFEPSFSQKIDNETILVPPLDPAVVFDGMWSWEPSPASGSNQFLTQSFGAQMSFSFNGTGVQVIGDLALPDNGAAFEPRYPTNGTYSLDGQPPTFFDIAPRLNTSRVFFNHPFFQIMDLTPGIHNLVLIYNGDWFEESLPLIITDLVVYGDVQGSDKTDISATNTRQLANGAERGGNLAKIVLVTVIPFVSLSAGIFAFWFFYWRRRRRKRVLTKPTPIHLPDSFSTPSSGLRETLRGSRAGGASSPGCMQPVGPVERKGDRLVVSSLRFNGKNSPTPASESPAPSRSNVNVVAPPSTSAFNPPLLSSPPPGASSTSNTDIDDQLSPSQLHIPHVIEYPPSYTLT